MLRFAAVIALILLTFSSCKKCYDCTKKCGTCTQTGFPTLAGCTGDESLNGASVDSWKLLLETAGYTCQFNNAEEEACGKDAKENKEKAFYECVAQ